MYFSNDAKIQDLEKANENQNIFKDQEKVIKDNVVEITMDAGNYFFTPKNVTANIGDMVRFKITNKKGFHNFKIDDLRVFSELPLNKETIVEFIVSKAGKFEYYCAVGNHRELGMFGILEVK